jgi:hypothetical protein
LALSCPEREGFIVKGVPIEEEVTIIVVKHFLFNLRKEAVHAVDVKL